MHWNRGHSPPFQGGVAARLQEMAPFLAGAAGVVLIRHTTTPAAPWGRGHPSLERRGMSSIPIHSRLHSLDSDSSTPSQPRFRFIHAFTASIPIHSRLHSHDSDSFTPSQPRSQFILINGDLARLYGRCYDRIDGL